MKRLSVNGKKQLTRKESAFVEEVAAGENQTKAVVKAGYSKKSAKVIGSQLANKAIVQEAIRERKNQAFRAHRLCTEMIIGGLNEIAFAPLNLLINDDGSIDLAEMKRLELTHLIKKMKVTQTPSGQKAEVEFYSRLDALKKLADIAQIKLPDQQVEDERQRSRFEEMVKQHSESRGLSLEETKASLLEYYKTYSPEEFDFMVRLGIATLGDDAQLG
jgi:phage terminase small subunit